MGIQRVGKKFRARIYRNGRRESKTHDSRTAAIQWKLRRQAELEGAALPDKTVGDAFDRYAETVSTGKKGHRWEKVRLRLLGRLLGRSKRLSRLDRSDISAWKEARLKSVSGASVAREMNLLQSVFNACIEWGWLKTNPVKGVKRPPKPPGRKRRIPQEQIDAIVAACGDSGQSWLTGQAFLFAIETAMRRGEICGITPERVNCKSVSLPMTKNGDSRTVPLSVRAREILAGVGGEFRITPDTLTELFSRARKEAGIDNLHFHDARAEAIWRLSKKLDPFELARVTGHRDMKMILEYYQADADELADKL